MKKRLIVPAAVLAVLATPGVIYGSKMLDTSSVAPSITSSIEDWSNNAAVISISDPAYFGGLGLDHYEYCVSTVADIDTCEWKTTSVMNIRIRNSGISYVWVRGISKNNVITDASNLVTTKIDRTKPDGSVSFSATTNTITATVAAEDNNAVTSIAYSIDGSDYIVGEEEYTFDNLVSGTEYTIKIKITDIAGNIRYLSYKQSTNEIVSAKQSKSKATGTKKAMATPSSKPSKDTKQSSRNKTDQSQKGKAPAEDTIDAEPEQNLESTDDSVIDSPTADIDPTEDADSTEIINSTEDVTPTEDTCSIEDIDSTEGINPTEDVAPTDAADPEDNIDGDTDEEKIPDEEDEEDKESESVDNESNQEENTQNISDF